MNAIRPKMLVDAPTLSESLIKQLKMTPPIPLMTYIAAIFIEPMVPSICEPITIYAITFENMCMKLA